MALDRKLLPLIRDLSVEVRDMGTPWGWDINRAEV